MDIKDRSRQTKICARCRLPQPVSAFCRDVSRHDGLRRFCRPCDAGRHREAYAARVGRPVRQYTASAPGTVLYAAAHRRVQRARGEASAHECAAGCGRPADCWAYDGLDPDQLTGTTGGRLALVAYSMDLDHYRPLCRHCHFRLRAARRRLTTKE